MPSVDSAVCDRMLGKEDSIRLARDHWLNTFKWEDEFVLKDGSVIRRSKHGITIEKDEIIEESQTQELFIENRLKNWRVRRPLSKKGAEFLVRKKCV